MKATARSPSDRSISEFRRAQLESAPSCALLLQELVDDRNARRPADLDSAGLPQIQRPCGVGTLEFEIVAQCCLVVDNEFTLDAMKGRHSTRQESYSKLLMKLGASLK